MKKIVAVCLCLLFLVQSAPEIFAAEVAEEQENTGNAGESEEDVRGESGLEISAPSAILMEASTGQVVYEKNPDWAGIDVPKNNMRTNCTSRGKPLEWLEEACAALFRAVPKLAGAFMITMSENPTHCNYAFAGNTCPRCRDRDPADLIAEVVAAAAAVVPEAPRILSGGRVMGDDELSDERKLDFIVDSAELYSCRRRIRQIRARLRSAAPDPDSDSLFAEATQLQRRVTELAGRLSSVFGT